jgi:cytochrome c oxidase cbb3-type subunit 1
MLGEEALRSAAMLTLLSGAVLWLLVALLFGLTDSIKFHAPSFLAGESYLSYGRVHAAQNIAFLYGFGVPAALGLGFWFLCRLGGTTLEGPLVVLIGATVWNCAVLLGVTAILCGRSTGFDSFEMPLWCARLLLLAYLLMAVCALLTFHQRAPGPLYPTQWFVVGSLFWFPWVFSTAALVLLGLPQRGVLQALTAWWCGQNMDAVFLGFAGLAASYYFIPKLLGRPLRSRYLAGLTFWTLALFGGCGGIPIGAPLPSWIVSLALVGTMLTVIPILAVAMNIHQTAHQKFKALDADPVLRFIFLGLLFWIIAGVQQIVGALPTVSAITDFTWFGAAQKELFRYGFFTLIVFGSIYYMAPQLLGLEQSAWSPGLLKLHFFMAFLGALISYVALLVAGLEQGILLANAANTFPDVMRRTMFPLRMSTLGDLLLTAGTFVFLANFAGLLNKARTQCCPPRKGVA